MYATEGLVTVQVSVNDPNSGDTHVYDWSLSDNSLAPDAAFSNDTFEIDPATLQPGTYIVRLSVSDDGSPAATTTVEMTFNVRSEPPTLGNTSDQDNDGIDDAAEGYSDSDGDGIANYLDAYDNTVLQGRTGRRTPVLLSTSAGLTLRLGSTAMAALNNEAMVSLADIDRFAAARGAAPASLDDGTSLEYPGGIVDFEVAGLGEHGQSVTVVIPQEVGLRPGAVYRKYTLDGGWRDFVIDAANSVASAPGSVVSCPAAGDPSYRAGLHAGDYCVQLVIQDGGPNDADGLANGVVQDPSGAGVSPAGAGEPTLAVDTGGGGGCSLAAVPTTATDPSLPLLTGLAFVLAVRRRARQR